MKIHPREMRTPQKRNRNGRKARQFLLTKGKNERTADKKARKNTHGIYKINVRNKKSRKHPKISNK